MRLPALLLPVIVATLLQAGHGGTPKRAELTYFFDRGYGQVEVGGRYVGMEFHDSRPLPSRISFYYPVANSIDLSTDYWRRADSHPLALGIRVCGGKKEWLGREPWAYSLSPHTVSFHRESKGLVYRISYEFCLTEPAAVMTVTIRNSSVNPLSIDLYSHLRLALRTCQTYERKELPLTEYQSGAGALAAHFDDPETDSATVFVMNDGQKFSWWTTSAEELGATDSGTSFWLRGDFLLLGAHKQQDGRQPAVAAFSYEQTVDPGDSLVVVQIIGSCRRDEWKQVVGRLSRSWPDDVAAYDQFIHAKAFDEDIFAAGDSLLDRSAVWARALIAANAHYLNGRIVPMPCPAEYNFFFTHDLLLTNLGAVNFDAARTKSAPTEGW